MHILWIDCEFTGLKFDDHILEIAYVLTDFSLNIIKEDTFIFHCSEENLSNMSDFVRDMHIKSNLLSKIKDSKYSYSDIENKIMDILKEFTVSKNIYIAGNSVYSDIFFIKKYMPKIIDWVNYRLIDISTLKILYQSMYSEDVWFKKKKKPSSFR